MGHARHLRLPRQAFVVPLTGPAPTAPLNAGIADPARLSNGTERPQRQHRLATIPPPAAARFFGFSAGALAARTQPAPTAPRLPPRNRHPIRAVSRSPGAPAAPAPKRPR